MAKLPREIYLHDRMSMQRGFHFIIKIGERTWSPLWHLVDAVLFKYMSHSAHHDWWVLGCDPIKGHLLVKCRLTQRTGLVKDASAEELLLASAKNFASYPWTEPHRVTQTPLKPQVIDLARQSQKLSGFMQKTQSLVSRRSE